MSIKARILVGFKLLLPLLLLILFVGWIVRYLENIFGAILLTLIPQAYYFPGLGLIVGAVTLCLISLAMEAWLVRTVYSWLINALMGIPLVETAYMWIQNIVKSISSTESELSSKPVIVNLEHGQALGFLTEEKLAERLKLKLDEDHVAVYFPMSYQIGGFTLLVPRNAITRIDLSTQEMFSIIMSAALVGKENHGNQKDTKENDE